MNELELIEKAKNKDEEAFNKLIKIYNEDIEILVSKNIKNMNELNIDRNDLKQECLLMFIKSIKYFNSDIPSTFRTFLINNIENRISDIFKIQNTKKARIESGILSLDKNLYNKIISKQYSPENELNLKERDKEIISLLSNEELKVYELKKEDLTTKEIAYILGKSPKSIYNTLERIKSKVEMTL